MLGTTPLERTVELLALTTAVGIFISGIMAMTGVSNPLLPEDWDPTSFEPTNDNTVVLSSAETVIRQEAPELGIPTITPAIRTGILWSVGSCYAIICYFCSTGVVAGSATEAAMRDELGVKMRSGTCCLTCCFLIFYIFGLMQIFADHPEGSGAGGVTICVLLIALYIALRIRKRQQDAQKVEASLQQDATAAVGAAAASGAYGSAPPNAYGDPYGAAPGAPAPEYDEKF